MSHGKIIEGDKICMITAIRILGVLLVFGGGVWFLQGINILPGSFMTGQIEWAIYGGIAIIVGIGLLIFANRRKSG